MNQEQLAATLARVRELEEALQPFAENIPEDYKAPCHSGITTARKCGRCGRAHRAYQALSTTTPDTALQRKVLEARIDELCLFKTNGSYSGSIEQNLIDRIEELRERRRALNMQDSAGTRSLLKDAVVADARTATRDELQRGVEQARRLRGW